MKINEILIKGYNVLKEAGIETYMLDTQLLLCKVLSVDKLYLMMNRDKEVDEDKHQEFLGYIEERKKNKPMGYILKEVEFMGLDFFIQEGVLIPRPDTEILVEECIKIINDKKINSICDMCTGSGAIGISIAHYVKDAIVREYDISNYAIETASRNINNMGLNERVTVEKSDLFTVALEKGLKFQMIVSNPPYIEEEVIPTLMSDVKDYEPHLALSGGEDGLIFYRRITEDSLKLLEKGGYLCFEIGYNQEKTVSDIMKSSGFINLYSLKDLGGNFRVVIGQLP